MKSLSETFKNLAALAALGATVVLISKVNQVWEKSKAESPKTVSASFSLIHVEEVNPRVVKITGERLRCFARGRTETGYATFTCHIMPPDYVETVPGSTIK